MSDAGIGRTLLEIIQELSFARDLPQVTDIVRRAARAIAAADGATFVLRDGDQCYYVDEDAIGPLWKGRRFPMETCISGWVMLHGTPAVIEDIYQDPRIPADAYRPTFVRSLAMVPVRAGAPVAAIGTYWATRHRPTDAELAFLQDLAHATALALANAELYQQLDAALGKERALNAALIEREQALQESDRRKDEFLAMLSHELRNPLGAIASAVRLLELAEPMPESGRRPLAVIARQTRHLGRLVDDLLDVTRLIRGKVELARQPLDLARLVTEAMAGWRAMGHFDHHDVSVEVAPAGVHADETRLEQVLTNLVGNALKYTPAGGRVAVRVFTDGAHAVLQVADNGPGIPPDLIGQVFDFFVQGQRSLARAEGGLGLGLTVVKALVELHDGVVDVTSDGQGSVFTVRLPHRPAGPSADGVAAEPLPPVRRRILVVEDNEDAREMLRLALQLAGHDVHTAADGDAALDLMRAQAPDVVLLDLGLPGLDGYEVARQVRALYGPRVLLVALTGYGRPEDRRRTLDSGFDIHLTKPVAPDHLVAMLAAGRAPTPDPAG